MKLLFAIKSLKVSGGGAERVLVDVANHLSKLGHDVQILTFDPPGPMSFYKVDAGIKIWNLDFGSPGVSTSFKRLILAFPRIRRTITSINPDVTIAFMHSTYVPLGLALLGTRQTLVTSEHVGYVHFARSKLQNFLASFIRGKAIATTVPTQHVKMGYPKREHDEITVLPNPVDISPYLRLPPAKEGANLILCVGRFMAEKDHDTLFEAFARLAQNYPQWTLKCVGDGELRPQLEEKIEQLGLQDRISLPGVSADMLREYEQASIVAIPSLYESFGMVAVEGLASGRPVIGFSDCGGMTEIIKSEETGLLIAPGNDRVAALEAGLRRLMGDDGFRLKLASRGPESVSKYQSHIVLEKWDTFFKSLKGA